MKAGIGYVVGAAIGFAALASTLVAVHTLVPDEVQRSDAVQGTVLIGSLIAFLIVQIASRGRFPLSLDYTIPSWMVRREFLGGTVWGTALSAGFVTQTPLPLLHLSVVAALAQPSRALVALTCATFVTTRFIVVFLPATRRLTLRIGSARVARAAGLPFDNAAVALPGVLSVALYVAVIVSAALTLVRA